MAGLGVLLVLGFYYLSSFEQYYLPEQYYPPLQNMNIGAFYLVPVKLALLNFIQEYLIFIFFEFGLLIIIFFFYGTADYADKKITWVAFFTLLLLPIFHFGNFNDLVMRVCIPSLFILQLWIIHAFTAGNFSNTGRCLLLLVFLVGATNSANMLRIKLTHTVRTDQIYFPSQIEHIPALMPYLRKANRVWNFTDQYVGSLDSIFFRYLADDYAEIKR